MARRRASPDALSSIFKKTEVLDSDSSVAKDEPSVTAPSSSPTDTSTSPTKPVLVPATGRTLPVGVGLKESEVGMLDQLAGELGIARNALLRYAVRYFLSAYQRGEIDLSANIQVPKPKKKLKMP